MDDGNNNSIPPVSKRFIRYRSLLGMLLIALTVSTQSGCSLFVMGGKMLFGDPKVDCAFGIQTGENLVKNEALVLVVCNSPDSVSSDYPSLNVDMLEGIARRLKREEVQIVNPNEVATWFDDNLGAIDDPTVLAEEFDADYVITIDIEEFSYREENSNELFRGRANAMVRAYEMRDFEGDKQAVEVFVRPIVSKYPEIYPIQADQTSEKTFRKKYLDRICEQVAQQFYDHPAGDVVY